MEVYRGRNPLEEFQEQVIETTVQRCAMVVGVFLFTCFPPSTFQHSCYFDEERGLGGYVESCVCFYWQLAATQIVLLLLRVTKSYKQYMRGLNSSGINSIIRVKNAVHICHDDSSCLVPVLSQVVVRFCPLSFPADALDSWLKTGQAFSRTLSYPCVS